MSAHTDPIVSAALVESLLSETNPIVRDHLIKGVTDKFLRYTRRTIVAAAEVVELHRGNDSASLYVKDWPLDTDETVQVEVMSGGSVIETLTLADSELQTVARTGEIVRLLGTWPAADGAYNLQVTYTGGWSVVPGDIEAAALEQIIADARRWEKEGAGVSNVSANGESLGYESAGLIESVKEAWGRYRNL